MFRRFALLVALTLICFGGIARATPVLLYANGTASGYEAQGTQRVTGNFTGTLYVDPATFNVTSEDITFNFSSGTTYTFKDSSIPAVSTAPGFGLYTDYSLVQNGTTTVQVVDAFSTIVPNLQALRFSFADNGAALFGPIGEPINTGASILGQGTEEGPYQATGYLTTVPEPSSLVLLGTGVLSLAGVARRRFVRA